MGIKIFKTQKEACQYYGHTWRYIEKHYHVVRSIGWVGDRQGLTGYSISEK
jgi:hypothetical protein